jgi:hypothetical protein
MKIFIALILTVLMPGVFPGIACEQTVTLDGNTWTFHRMEDGNSYHEIKNPGEFTEGDTLALDMPCRGRLIDTIQVDWEDNRSEVKGELVTMPGHKRHGARDISGKKRVSWTLGRKTDSFRIEFSGTRRHRARVRWIRVFYGVNAPPYHAEQPLSSSDEGCETTVMLDGKTWTFHRMQDGNSYHGVKDLGIFSEGDTLRLEMPCRGRLIDSIQIDWDDNRGEVKGELVTMPGHKRHGIKDVSDRRRESWALNRSVNSFRIDFSGQRGHRARIRWIRVFYGVNTQKQSVEQSLSSVD